jgi:heme/copper-type cytochrome/quinol oxidase subunit 2
VPNQAGDNRIVCNEFCGIGHHTMVGRIIVTEGPNGSPTAPATNSATAAPAAAPGGTQ